MPFGATEKGARRFVDLPRPGGRELLGSPPTRHDTCFLQRVYESVFHFCSCGLVISILHGPFVFTFSCAVLPEHCRHERFPRSFFSRPPSNPEGRHSVI
jgi:hypothetical protein